MGVLFALLKMKMKRTVRVLMAHNTLRLYLLLLILVSPGGVIGNNQDSDYLLDESFANLNKVDRNEVERLLREYPANQELVRSIGAQYYQFVNVAQIRHHQLIGLSTREGTSKGPRAQAQVMQAPQQTRTGKHFHRASFLIQAFNHKFRLILELNPTLIAPNVIQKHILNEQTLQRERTELEMCYYHGIVEGLEWSAAAVRTCNGLSGIIHMGNETFVIHPFQGGDLSHKHPHIVFEAKSLGRQVCGNKRGLEYNMPSGLSPNSNDNARRIEDNAPKYFVELALLLDKPMFDKRNGSTRLAVVHDALQIANIADLYFRKLSTAISVVYIETWFSPNHLQVDVPDDLRKTLVRLTDIYGPRNLFGVNKDSTMLLSGVPFSESGMAIPTSICTAKAMGVVTDVSTYQPHITGVALAHMIGHNLNMGHDHDLERCHCPTWYGCIMNENIVGNDGIHPYIFSDCSRRAFYGAINNGHAMCLINRPNAIDPVYKSCGNGIVEGGEECDCGSDEDCARDPCCEHLSCRLKTTAECSSHSPCCENCKFSKSGSICRHIVSECDIPETCTGQSGECPMNTFKKNGSPCSNGEGYCYNGYCPSLTHQCERIWDWNSKAAKKECFESLNIGGHHNGHCGREHHNNYRKCDKKDVMCGTLHCKDGSSNPTLSSRLQNNTYTKIILKLPGHAEEYECKSLAGPIEDRTLDQIELVRDGTKCGDNRICMNQTCVSLLNFVDNQKCPSNHAGLDCSGQGDCSNINVCHCFMGWEGADCSRMSAEQPPTVATTITPIPAPQGGIPGMNMTAPQQPGKETRKQKDENGTNTIVLVFGMVSVVGGVFIMFAMMALCYRRSTVPKFESNFPPFNPQSFKLPGGGGGSVSAQGNVVPPQLSHEEIDNRILSFTQLPAYRDQHSSLGMHGSMKNLGSGVGGGTEDELGDETSAFLDNNEGLCDVERTLKSLNGYHEDILAALRIAAQNRGIGDLNATPPPQGGPRLSDGYPDYPDFGSEFPLLRNSNDLIPGGHGDDESNDETGGPIRIRNLEDLLRQLEHHTAGRHLSPCGSEDLRLSETEADRHYRGLHSDLGGDLEEGGFVMGRYRPGLTSRNLIRSPLSDYGHFTAAAAATPDDDLDSTQMNLLNTSTSEEDDEPTNAHMARTLTPRNLMKNIYHPSEDSYGSESPRRHNGVAPPNY